MRMKAFLILLMILTRAIAFASETEEKGKWRWDFDLVDGKHDWSIPEHFGGKIYGGSLWLALQAKPGDFSDIHCVKDGKPSGLYTIDSAKGLGIPADKYNKVRIRLLNLSPETDGLVHWLTTDDPEDKKIASSQNWHPAVPDSAHFPMKPYCKEWQEIICHIDGKWKGTIDQIFVTPGMLGHHKGDIWIDWIEVTSGPSRPKPKRPDIVSDKVVPEISIPGITQEDFKDAFRVLDESMYIDVPFQGFEYPFFAPGSGGSGYGWSCWPGDGTIALGGVKWSNQKVAENAIRNFIGVQKDSFDGRFDHNGFVPQRGGPYHLTQLSTYFLIAYDIACRSNNNQLREEIYRSLIEFFEWWHTPNVKYDPGTGLVTAYFEESVSSLPYTCGIPHRLAPLDTNVWVAVGADRISKMSRQLGYAGQAKKYRRIFEEHKKAINKYLWNEEDGVYYPYDIKKQEQEKRLGHGTFEPFIARIADSPKIEELIPKLLDPDLFNWGGKAFLTSVAKTHPHFAEAKSWADGANGLDTYCWHGNVWAPPNLMTTTGLCDIGRFDLAGELAWKTIKTFNANHGEAIQPSTGERFGVPRYCWSASVPVQMMIEYIFGINYNLAEKRLAIMPLIPEELADKQISIKRLILPTGEDTRLAVFITANQEERLINIEIDGGLVEDMNIEVLQAQAKDKPLPEVVEGPESTGYEIFKKANHCKVKGLETIVGVRTPTRKSLKVRFGL